MRFHVFPAMAFLAIAPLTALSAAESQDEIRYDNLLFCAAYAEESAMSQEDAGDADQAKNTRDAVEYFKSHAREIAPKLSLNASQVDDDVLDEQDLILITTNTLNDADFAEWERKAGVQCMDVLNGGAAIDKKFDW